MAVNNFMVSQRTQYWKILRFHSKSFETVESHFTQISELPLSPFKSAALWRAVYGASAIQKTIGASEQRGIMSIQK